MADTTKGRQSAQAARMVGLREEAPRILSIMGHHAPQSALKAEDAAENLVVSAKRAAHDIRAQVRIVSDTARGNPATVVTILAAAGLIGMTIGFRLGRFIGKRR